MKKTAIMITFLLLAVGIFGLVPNDGQDVDLGTYVEGTVTDLKSGDPIQDAFIRIWGSGGGYGTFTDSNGFYQVEVDVRVKSDMDIFCDKNGYYEEYTSIEITRGDTEVVDFALEPMNSTIKGYVYDSETMEPIPEVYVSIYSTEPDGGDQQWVWADEDGYFEIFAESGYYKLTSGAEGYERYTSEEFYLGEGEVKEVEILLIEIETGIYGRVTNNEGETLENVWIDLYTPDYQYWFDGVTDENGKYEIKAAPGEYIISVFLDDHFSYNDEVTIMEDGLTEYNIEMTKISLSTTLQYILEMIKQILNLAPA